MIYSMILIFRAMPVLLWEKFAKWCRSLFNDIQWNGANLIRWFFLMFNCSFYFCLQFTLDCFSFKPLFLMFTVQNLLPRVTLFIILDFMVYHEILASESLCFSYSYPSWFWTGIWCLKLFGWASWRRRSSPCCNWYFAYPFTLLQMQQYDFH